MGPKKGLAAPVFVPKAREFNLLSVTGFACPPAPARRRSARISGVHGILQRLSGLEYRNRRGGDRHVLARSRVARGAGRPVPGAERAEAEYPCLLAIRQGLADGLEHAVNGILRGGLAHSRPPCQALGQFPLVHPRAPVFDNSIRFLD